MAKHRCLFAEYDRPELGGPLILYMGTEAEKQKYIKGILSAEDIWCQGFSEPDHGSDLGSAQCRAVKDGDEYVVKDRRSGPAWVATPST